MQQKTLLGIVVAATLSHYAFAENVQSVVRDASKAIGADSIKTLQYTANGFDYAIGQQANPKLPWPKFIEKQYSRSIDFDVAASRVERIRLQGESPPHGGGGQPIVGEQTQTQFSSARADAPWAQQAELYVTPYGFLRLAATKPVTLESKQVNGKQYKIVTVTVNNNKVIGYINSDNLVERVDTKIDNAVLGDIAYESTYSDYRSVGNVKFPYHIVQQQGGYPVYDLKVNDVKVNVPVTIILPGQNTQASVTKSEKLGEGVYLITGGYSVIAVDFKDHIVLFESGQNDERAAAVIAETKRLIPNKPIKYVVNTHPHFDHSGGLRAFVAEGITIMTHETNKAYLEKVLAQPRTAGPQPNGKKPKVEGIGDKKILTDGEHVVEIYRLKDFGHHDAMLTAYFPKEKVLFEADAYNPQALTAVPPTPASPFNVSLLKNISALKLDVQRIVPVHYPNDNRVITLAELQRWVTGEKLAAQ
jgi:glyoxylase-like metal-dependent hydrolase (beta-lactamase superfamily II)